MSYGPARSVGAHDSDAGGHFTLWFLGVGRNYRFREGWVLVLIQGILFMVGVAAAVLGLLGILDRLDLYSLPGLPV